MNDVQIPLCVQLDGALTPVNTRHEKLLALMTQPPRKLLAVLGALRRGMRAFWRSLGAAVDIDAECLPVHPGLVEWLREQHEQGRHLVLLAGHDVQAAEQLAQRLQVFDEVTTTELGHARRLSGRDMLLERYGKGGFDFVGTELGAPGVLEVARRVVIVGRPARSGRIARTADVTQVFAAPRASLRTWIKALRLHQWVKNALIFIPALLAHTVTHPDVMLKGLLGFIAFGFCASSVYVLNDLFDLPSDRRHPRKRQRPFAAGVLSARSGLVAAGVLLTATIAIALTVNLPFLAVLAGYYVLTWSYSLRFKRVAMLDVMMLAGLYTVRIIAGAAATSVPLSFWLLAFSVFMFLSLGFVKRYAELDGLRQGGAATGSGRGYGTADLPLIMSLGTAAGYCCIVVLALYLDSTTSQSLYHHHKPLWLICPLMLYWISRIWTQTTRGLMHDDPVVFALRDWVSLIVLGLLAAIVVLSI
jgi:4-hydroxybenzoate polyprenyltransferase